jgi:hypothetical protein
MHTTSTMIIYFPEKKIYIDYGCIEYIRYIIISRGRASFTHIAGGKIFMYKDFKQYFSKSYWNSSTAMSLQDIRLIYKTFCCNQCAKQCDEKYNIENNFLTVRHKN